MNLQGPIFWAIDPFLENETLSIKAANLLAVIHSGLGGQADIQPVTILSPEQLNWPEQFQGDWEIRFREAVSGRITQFIASSKHALADRRDRIREPLLLSQGLNSVRRSVDELVRAAVSAHASMIVAATQASHGLSHFVLGSFCETLITLSPMPVLTVNPGTEIPTRIRSILYPTDLTQGSKEKMREASQFARLLGARLILLHKLMLPAPAMIEPGFVVSGADVGTVQSLFEAHRKQQEQELSEWRRELEQEGLEVDSRFIFGSGNLAGSIAEAAAHENESLLVTALQTDSAVAVFLGHISKDIVRQAKRPTLTLPI